MNSTQRLYGSLLAVLTSACVEAPRVPTHAPIDPQGLAQLASTAQAWLTTLDVEQRLQACVPFDSEARRHWAFVPGERAGLRLSQMQPEQREQALVLVKQALSTSGARQVDGVRALEAMLSQLVPGSYDDQWYDLLLLGDPAQAPWAFRFEGHHLSFLFASDGSTLSVTPFFVGASPFTVRGGEMDAYAPLQCERDRAFALHAALSAEQRAQARSAVEAPSDVWGAPGSAFERLRALPGLRLDQMDPQAQSCFWNLVECYTQRLREPLATLEFDRIRKLPAAQLIWTWAGSESPAQRHYYCIRGPSFAIEFDCTNSADHVHTVWHDFERDHGDALLEHLRSAPHAQR